MIASLLRVWTGFDKESVDGLLCLILTYDTKMTHGYKKLRSPMGSFT
jgi:hypothetical protein